MPLGSVLLLQLFNYHLLYTGKCRQFLTVDGQVGLAELVH